MKYERLFSPLTIRGCTFPNRIMSTAAVTRLAAEDGHVTKNIKDRYVRLAMGGVGSMVIEAAVVLPSRSSFNLRISDDLFVPELMALVDAVRAANPEVKVGLQIMHFLKVARSGWRQKVEDLREEDLQSIPLLFGEAGRRTREAGFDFVEIHMAHFTTLASFLSLVNKRADEYGGDFESRIRLPLEVVRAVRGAAGADFPIGVRINGEEFTKEGNTLLQSARIARRMAAEGIDYISVSAGERFEDAAPMPEGFPPFPGTGYSGARMSPRWWSPDGTQVYLAEGIRRAVRGAGWDIPVVAAGKIRRPGHGEEILNQGKADIIGMARTLFADPDWPLKAREGRDEDIVHCAACGYCSESDERYEKVTCINWPKGALHPPSPWMLKPPCSAACPAGIDIRSYVDLTVQGRFSEALSVIRESCPFPGVVSRVCPSFCEKKCNRAGLDEAVAVNSLKRFLVERVGLRQEGIMPPPRDREERIAIVGSGPAGLSAGYFLARMGYGVTVFEALPVAGGMMSVGIQESRLPRDLVNAEIENIRRAGVEIRTSSPVGEKGLSLEDLRRLGYKVLFLAVGTKRKRELKLPGGGEVSTVYGDIPDLSFLKGDWGAVIETDPDTLMTNLDGVFAGGDLVNGPTSVIQAVASGWKGARAIDQYLRGGTLNIQKEESSIIGIDAVDTGMFKKRGRKEIPERGVYEVNAALSEADRCLQCGMFPKK